MRITHKALGGAMMALALAAGLASPVLAQAQDVDFGDDSSQWSNDGQCDDPRFTGEGMAEVTEDDDILNDATDCEAAFDAGTITLAEGTTEPAESDTAEATETATAAPEIDFGNDSSTWANDDECDDPRFVGDAMANGLNDDNIGRDATDCQAAFEAGDITLEEGADASVTVTAETAEIDFGDDTSQWANDDECDDPRFVGDAMAGGLNNTNIGRDATDCRAAFEAGDIALSETQPDNGGEGSASVDLTALANRIDFGDDSGSYPNDNECDDPDFVGSAMALSPLDSNRLGDATDCRAAFLAGTVSLKAAAAPVAFNYGSDYSSWANDGECDDWRFTGAGMSKKLFAEDVMSDATDCETLEQAGEISIKPVFQPDYALNGPYDSAGVDFGNNSSSYANDDICDDPRFEGPGVASTLLEGDRLADAADCQSLFEQGTITLREDEV